MVQRPGEECRSLSPRQIATFPAFSAFDDARHLAELGQDVGTELCLNHWTAGSCECQCQIHLWGGMHFQRIFSKPRSDGWSAAIRGFYTFRFCSSSTSLCFHSPGCLQCWPPVSERSLPIGKIDDTTTAAIFWWPFSNWSISIWWRLGARWVSTNPGEPGECLSWSDGILATTSDFWAFAATRSRGFGGSVFRKGQRECRAQWPENPRSHHEGDWKKTWKTWKKCNSLLIDSCDGISELSFRISHGNCRRWSANRSCGGSCLRWWTSACFRSPLRLLRLHVACPSAVPNEETRSALRAGCAKSFGCKAWDYPCLVHGACLVPFFFDLFWWRFGECGRWIWCKYVVLMDSFWLSHGDLLLFFLSEDW